MKITFNIIVLLLFCAPVFAQSGGLNGTVKDAGTGETLLGVSVSAAPGKGAVTDVDGNFSMKLDSGEYTVIISFFGYQTQTVKTKISNKAVSLNISLESMTLDEVEIVSDVARIRETPIAFTNISGQKLQEELSSRDLPMVLNNTPGAYATEQCGGSGDSRFNLRGFDQRNIAVMVDGVPVNDMENGWVYWSNWNGLGDVTRTVQIQRGLGASRLVIPSVGGTMNILTRGIESKRYISLKQEFGSDMMLKTSLGFNSGQLKKGWGFTLAGTRKTGDGWVDQTWTDAWSYFFKVQKRFDKHLISLSANGAPQKHGQRLDRMPIAVYDKEFAKQIIDKNYADSSESVRDDLLTANLLAGGYTTVTQGPRGMRYNPHWGYLDNGSGSKPFNERVNYFHKPQVNLSHFWTLNDKFNISNVAYLSIGRGGGARLSSSINRDTLTGQLNMQQFYDQNASQIDALYSATEHKSSRIISSSVNNHIWYGLLSTATWEPDTGLVFVFGLDGRYYRGTHYREVYDLFGGDYYINTSDQTQPSGAGNLQYSMKRKGDKITYHNDSYVYWGGSFAQCELKKNKWSAFVTLTFSGTGYQRIDFFRNMDIVLPETTLVEAVGYGDTVVYNGNSYTISSPEARNSTTKLKWFPGYTVKGGVNYNISRHHNVFMNSGYLSMAPRFNNVFDNSNKEFLEIENQKVIALEMGYGIRYPKWAVNTNLYFTRWENMPPQFTPTVNISGDVFSYNINGLTAIHKGVEVDGSWRITRKFTLEGLVSIGDWITDTQKKVYIYDADEVLVDSVEFSAKKVHIGDAAQYQCGAMLRYEIIKGLFVKANYTWFGKNFANFDPLELTGVNADRESWRMPNYSLLDLHAGYEFRMKKFKINLGANLLNILDTYYITDAKNGSDFNAGTALVYLGMGRRFVTSLKITY